VPDVSRHLRPRDGSAQPTTPVELLFDLVYVIAITQLSHLVIDHQVSLESVAQASFLLLVVWWAWIYTTWMVNFFDPSSGAVRLVLMLCGLASLMMSAALPRAFADRALLFAGCYVALQFGRNASGALLLDRTHGRTHGLSDTFERLTAWSAVSGVLWILGGTAGSTDRMAWWGPALAVDLLAPAVGYWLPGRGRVRTDAWSVEGSHFAERCQAFIIIALGESIAVTALSASAGSLRGGALLALGVAFVETGALWWLYFGEVAERSRRQLAKAEDPGQLARDAYTYLHLPIVAGIIMVAVANAFLTLHSGRRAGGPVTIMLVGGPALYLIGDSLFRLRMIGSVSPKRIGAIVVVCALGALSPVVSTFILALCVTGVLTGLALAEYEPLIRRLRPGGTSTVAQGPAEPGGSGASAGPADEQGHRQPETSDPDDDSQRTLGKDPDDRRAAPAAGQSTDAESSGIGPVHGGDDREDDASDSVGRPGGDVLDRVGDRERLDGLQG
jgi:low temperature requirement protein LtrA